MSESTIRGRARRDYLRCLDCSETLDYWKYDTLADSGHDGHTLRALTPEEFQAAMRECGEECSGDE